jgi:hypothetical protein
MKRLLNIIANLTLIAIGLILGLLAVEQAVPYYWHGQVDYGWDGSFEYDPTLGWRNRPNFSMVGKPPDSSFGRVEYTHNSRGLRGVYQLEIGMYDPASDACLPIIGEKGEIQGDRTVLKKIAVRKQ